MYAPVALPPGRLRLMGRPDATGSTPLTKTIGIVVVAALAASAAAPPPVVTITATRRPIISGQRYKSIGLTIRGAEINLHVPAFDVTGVFQRVAECRHQVRVKDWPSRNPITGIAGCGARAASGQAAAPSSVMNCRRFIRSPRRRGLTRAAGR